MTSGDSPIEIVYSREQYSENRLFVVIPGINGSAEGDLGQLIDTRSERTNPLRYNSLAVNWMQKHFSYERAVDTLKENITQVVKESGTQDIVVFASSYGASLALSTLNVLSEDVRSRLKGCLLFSPVTDKTVLSKKMRILSKASAKKLEQAVTWIYRRNSSKGGLVTDKPSQLLFTILREFPEYFGALKSFSKDCNVQVVRSRADFTVDNNLLEAQLKTVFPGVQFSTIEMSGPGSHRFSKGDEWSLFFGDTLLPFLQNSFRAHHFSPLAIEDEAGKFELQLIERDKRRLSAMEQVFETVTQNGMVDIRAFLEKIARGRNKLPAFYELLDQALPSTSMVSAGIKEKFLDCLINARKKELDEFHHYLKGR